MIGIDKRYQGLEYFWLILITYVTQEARLSFGA